MPDYPPNYDPMMNIPVWLVFKFPTGREGTTKSKGTPYKKFAVELNGVEHTWWVYNLNLATQIEAILADCKRNNRAMELAYMQTEGEGKAHLHCLSDRLGGLQCTVPLGKTPPKHFLDFVGVPTIGGGATDPQPVHSGSPPPSPSVRKTMAECLNEAYVGWYAILEYASRHRFEVDESEKADAQLAFDNVNKAMGECLGMTASSIFNRG